MLGLKKPNTKKDGASRWFGGIWIGKNPHTDMDVILSSSGSFTTRSVRRCAHPWRKEISR